MPYAEDLKPGLSRELGHYTVTRSEIIRFATAWDPQRFHLEDDHGCQTPFDGLIASGWQTASIYMRLFVDNFLSDGGGTGSPGVDVLRWPEPVRPGDTLGATLTVERIMPSLGHRDRMIAILRCELRNQHGRIVMSMNLNNMFLRRPSASDDESAS